MGILELAGVALVAIIAAFFSGKSRGRADERAEIDKEHIETRKRMDEITGGDEPSDARKWLHERGKR